MFTLKHLFNSPQADGVDPTLVKPSDWNAQHAVESSTDGVLIGRPIGAGPGDMEELPFSSILPSGIVVPYAGVAAPTGWLMCYGQIVNVSDWPALFAVLSATFGGNGVSTFGIPDLRGRVVAGPDNGVGRLTIFGAGLAGAGGGQQATNDYGGIPVSVTMRGNITFSTYGPSPPFQNVQDGFTGVATSGHNHAIDINSIVSDGATLSPSYRTVNTVQPTLCLNYMIKG
jgi:microcystin-dependent protein